MKSSCPRAQVGEAHAGIDDGQVDDAIEVDRAFVPVVLIALEHDAVLRHALDEFERPRAHRFRAELVAGRLRRLGRDHHAGAAGEYGEERRERRGEVEPHRLRIHRVYAGHRASSPRRFDPCMVLCRSRLNFTAAASSFSPSWNVTRRSLRVSVL